MYARHLLIRLFGELQEKSLSSRDAETVMLEASLAEVIHLDTIQSMKLTLGRSHNRKRISHTLCNIPSARRGYK